MLRWYAPTSLSQLRIRQPADYHRISQSPVVGSRVPRDRMAGYFFFASKFIMSSADLHPRAETLRYHFSASAFLTP